MPFSQNNGQASQIDCVRRESITVSQLLQHITLQMREEEINVLLLTPILSSKTTGAALTERRVQYNTHTFKNTATEELYETPAYVVREERWSALINLALTT